MYPFERDMGIYKSYTRNRAHPEGSIAEAYSIYEALTFCSMYFTDSEHQFTHPDRNDDQVEQKGTISVFVQKAKPFGGASIEEWSKSDIEEIHFAVLNHCDELADFVNEHMRQLEMNCPEDLYERHRDNFSSWFQQHGISKRNSQNRAKQAYNHRAGSKPFVFHEAALSQAAGSPIGFLELFKSTHYSENKGWVNDIAENQYNEMKNLIEESQSSPNGPITEDEARKLVLGTKSGYVRGYGRSRLPPQSPSLVSAQASMIKSLEGEVGDMRVKIKDQDEKMAKMFQMIELLQRDRNIESPGARCSRDGSHSPNEVDDLNYY